MLKSSPILLPDDVPFAGDVCLVDEEASLVEAGFKATNDRLSWESHFEMDLFVDFVSDIIEAFFNENDFVYVIQFGEEELPLVVMHWLKILKNLDHEVLVLEIAPRVEAVLVSRILVWNAEIVSEALQETHEQEISVNLPLNLNRKLFNQSLVFWCTNTLVFIIPPSVVKVLFYSNFHIIFDALSLIELFDKSKEFAEHVSLVEFFVHANKRIKDFDEIAHDDGEDGNTE